MYSRNSLYAWPFIILTLSATVSAAPLLEEPVSPLPQEVHVDARKVGLGENLFKDTRLSGKNGMSCMSCHLMKYALTDGTNISYGPRGSPGAVNTTTLFNVGLRPKISWSGQTPSLQQQIINVVQSKATMGASWVEVMENLQQDESLKKAFNDIYPDGLTQDNLINALVEYEKSLITPDAPFDRYLRGDPDAITQRAKEGYELFKSYGCVSCHQGMNLGANMLQISGIFSTEDAVSRSGNSVGAKGTGIDDKRPIFRVPSLRNVAVTAPYFHDGSAPTLAAAISIMSIRQLGRSLPDEDVKKIEEFLKTLTGNLHGKPVVGQ